MNTLFSLVCGAIISFTYATPNKSNKVEDKVFESEATDIRSFKHWFNNMCLN